MSLLSVCVQCFAIYSVTWVLWRTFRHLIVQSPLDKIPGPPSPSFVTGHLARLFHRYGWDLQHELGHEYGMVVKYNGLFGSKNLFVFDPVALNSIVVKDQYVYEETDFFILINHMMFGEGLLATLGDHHRKQRKLLNPVFHINQMRHMLPIFYEISYKLRDAITSCVKNEAKEIDILHWLGRTALELIGQGGLGYSFDPLTEEVPNEYADAVKSFQEVVFPLSRFRNILQYLFRLGPASFRRQVVELLPLKFVQNARHIADTIEHGSKTVFEAKKVALQRGDEAVAQQTAEGKDIMSKLLQANMAASEEDRLPETELLGQMGTLIFAATDTTSSALSRILQLLADHQDIQQKLREEITAAQDGRESIPYDELSALPYLDAVCRETLRMYPPVTQVVRTARKDIVMPVSTPIKAVDGSMINEVFVPKGTDVVIGILASNRNPVLWGPDASEWKPERWLSPLPDKIGQAHIPGIYSNLMTFLGGGRACIGFKFSQMEMKVVLAVLLGTFRFSMTNKPIYWNLAGVQYPTVGTTSSKGMMPLKVELLQEA